MRAHIKLTKLVTRQNTPANKYIEIRKRLHFQKKKKGKTIATQ